MAHIEDLIRKRQENLLELFGKEEEEIEEDQPNAQGILIRRRRGR